MAGRRVGSIRFGVGVVWIAALVACDRSSGVPTAGPSGTPAGGSAAPGTPTAAARPPLTFEGSTIAVAPTEDAIFVADEDAKVVRVLALPLRPESRPTRIEMPGRPAQLIVTEDRVLVTVRELAGGRGALLVLARKGATDLEEVSRTELPADAWGLALARDQRSALVTSAWTHALSRVELASAKVTWTVNVEREPRGITLLDEENRAYVSHLIGSGVTRVDDLGGATPKVSRVALPASPTRSPGGEELEATLGYAITRSPEGDRVFVPRHALGGYKRDAWFGTATVDVFDTQRDAPIAGRRPAGPPSTFIEPMKEAMGQVKWWAATEDVVVNGASEFYQPRAAVYRKREKTLLVASEGGDRVVELDALMSDPSVGVLRTYHLGPKVDPFVHAALHGGAPSGIALSRDENVAFVHCRSTDEVAIVELVQGEGRYDSVPPRFIPLAEPTGERDFVMGRRLFYNATDSVMSGGMACAGCHPEGRDDGHVWHEVQFGPSGKPDDVGRPVTDTFSNFFATASSAKKALDDWQEFESPNTQKGGGAGFARQTPMLAGRVSARGPYGWLAENPDVTARVTAGFDLHRWKPADTQYGTKENAVARAAYITTFLRNGLVAPPNPERPLTEEEQRGKDVFSSAKAECVTCHAPDAGYTNRTPALLVEGPVMPGFVREQGAAYRTPSLLFVAGTAPYFHDGRYATLEELIEKNADRMGKTSHLTEEEKKALVAFLKTL